MLFDIKLQVNQQVFAAGATIKFNHPIINTGNVYRTDHGMYGIFEPPVNGVYSFTVTVCTFPFTWMLFGLIKDGTVLDEVMVGDNDWHACGTSTTNTYVTTANKVWVKVLQTNRGVLNTELGVSSFKGILLSTSKP